MTTPTDFANTVLVLALLALAACNTETRPATLGPDRPSPIAAVQPEPTRQSKPKPKPQKPIQKPPAPPTHTCTALPPKGQPFALSDTATPSEPRIVALTFDDGPDLTNTAEILDTLSKRDIRAAFFITGRSITAQNRHLLERMVKEGHTLGNHGYFHLLRYAKRSRLGPRKLQRNLLVNQAVLDVALLARSDKDFKALYTRLLGGPPKQYPSQKILNARWTQVRDAWIAILRERTPDGQSPAPMLYARLPGGAPYVGESWTARSVVQSDLGLVGLGVINTLWHGGIGDTDVWMDRSERLSPDRLGRAIAEGFARGGIMVIHDRGPVGPLSSALRRDRGQTAFVTLDHFLKRAHGCPPEEAHRAMLQSLTLPSGCDHPWRCD